ncbi:hypothetical protein KPB2_5363 [Klebsiella pneumoniae Kb677]|nr:hypothetical protein KPB2_5363 [Klebsiella pneumoniae Kb677]
MVVIRARVTGPQRLVARLARPRTMAKTATSLRGAQVGIAALTLETSGSCSRSLARAVGRIVIRPLTS